MLEKTILRSERLGSQVFGRKEQRSGFSLVELIVTSGLVVLLGSLFVWFLVVTSQATSQGSARVDIQQRTILVLKRIVDDLRQCSPETVTCLSQADATGPEPIALSMIPIEDVDNEGRKRWKPQVVGYYWKQDDRSLHYRKWADPSGLGLDPLPHDSPYRLTLDELRAFAGVSGTQLASGVANFDAEKLGEAVRLKMAIEKDVAGKNAPLRFEFEQSVVSRQ